MSFPPVCSINLNNYVAIKFVSDGSYMQQVYLCMQLQSNQASGAFAQTIAGGRVAVLPAGVGVGGVTPWSSTVIIRVSAKVGLQVRQWILLWRKTV